MFKYLQYYYQTLAYCQLCRLPQCNIICHSCYHELNTIKTKICLKCLKTCLAHQEYCYACSNNQTYFDKVYSKFSYTKPLATILHQLKYQSRYKYKWLLGYLLNESLSNINEIDVIIPMPMFSGKRRYNHIELLLDYYRVFSGHIPINSNIVTKTKDTLSQALIKFNQRHDNLNNAFVVNTRIDQLNILIVDDIITTGSSCNELAKVLKHRGANKVEICTLMRTL